MKVDADRLAELEEERAFLLRSLDDLEREREAGDMDDTDYAELRDGYISRAASVLREIDDGRAALPAGRRRRRGRTIAVVVALVAVAIAAGFGVAFAAGERLPGATVTGNTADTVNNLLAEARSLEATDPKGAIDRFERVLKIEPDNTEALTYDGWLVARVGAAAGAGDLVDKGEASIDRAIALEPTYADPSCFKAIIRFQYHGDAAGAKGPIDRCLAANPPAVVKSLVDGLHDAIVAALAAGPSGGGSGSVPPTTSAGTTAVPSTTIAP